MRILARVDDPDRIEFEARSIRASLEEEEGRFTELFTTYRRPLLLGIMLAGLQQISGITPIFAFLPEIFRVAGTARGDSFFQTVLVSVINLIFTFVGLWLVDTAGRRAIILAGTTVQWLALFSVGWLYHVHGSGIAILVFVMSFVAGHAFGNGIACWVLISEFYPTRVRGRAMSMATTFLWIVGFLGSQSFPVLDTIFRSGRHLLDILRGRAADHHPGGRPGSGRPRAAHLNRSPISGSATPDGRWRTMQSSTMPVKGEGLGHWTVRFTVPEAVMGPDVPVIVIV